MYEFSPDQFQSFMAPLRAAGIEMGQQEAQDYASWADSRKLTAEQLNSSNYVNLFREQSGAFDPKLGGNPSLGPKAGPGFVQAGSVSSGSFAMMPVNTATLPQQRQQEAQARQRLVADAELRAFQMRAAAEKNPRSVADTILDSSATSIKTDLNRLSARTTLELTGRHGNDGREKAALTPTYSEGRDGANIDIMYRVARGNVFQKDSTTPRFMASEANRPVGLGGIDVPKIATDDAIRTLGLLDQSPTGKAISAQVRASVMSTSERFMAEVATNPPQSLKDYVSRAEKAFGPLADMGVALALQKIPESVLAAEKAQAASDAAGDKLEATASFADKVIEEYEARGGVVGTGQTWTREPDGSVKFVQASADVIREARIRAEAKRAVYTTPDIGTKDGREVAVSAGLMDRETAAMLGELDTPMPEVKPPDGAAEPSAASASVSRLGPNDISSAVDRVLRQKRDGATQPYQELLRQEVGKLAEGDSPRIVGSDALKAAMADADKLYRDSVRKDADSQVNSRSSEALSVVSDRDAGLKARADKFVQSFTENDGRVKSIADRVLMGGVTRGEIDEEAELLAASDLGLTRDDLYSLRALRGNPRGVDALMPNIAASVDAARRAIDKEVALRMANDTAASVKAGRELLDKWSSMAPQDKAAILRLGGLKPPSQWSESDLRMAGEVAKMYDDKESGLLTEVGRFATVEQANAARALIREVSAGEATRIINDLYKPDPKTGLLGTASAAEAQLFEATYTGRFDQLFAAPKSNFTGSIGRNSGSLFTSDSKKQFETAVKALSTSAKTDKNGKRVFNSDAHMPEYVKLAPASIQAMWRSGAEKDDLNQMRLAYAMSLVNRDYTLRAAFSEAKGLHYSRMSKLGAVEQGTDGRWSTTKEFDEILAGASAADGIADADWIRAAELLALAREANQDFSEAIDGIKASPVAPRNIPSIPQRSRSLYAESESGVPVNSASGMIAQLEGAMRRNKSAWDIYSGNIIMERAMSMSPAGSPVPQPQG